MYPLWADATATQPNVHAEVLQILATTYGATVAPEEVIAYVAAVMAHPAFTARFKADLVRPGLRVPLTGRQEPVRGGRRARARGRWLHCYGERFADPAAGRPKGPPRMAPNEQPTIPADGRHSGSARTSAADYDLRRGGQAPPHRQRLRRKRHAGHARFEISGKTVLDQWFSYRRLDRTKPQIGDRRPPSPLEKIQPEGWLAEYTTDLLNLLNVLGRLVALEGRQADLLDRIVAGALVALTDPPPQKSGTTEADPSQ